MAGPLIYNANPRYTPAGEAVRRGWPAAVADLPSPPFVLAVDGPAALAWDAAVAGLTRVLSSSTFGVQHLDVRSNFAPWEKIVTLTDSPPLAGDPHFATLAEQDLIDLFEQVPEPVRPTTGVLVAFGPGAALVRHDVLWYADIPKRYVEAVVSRGDGRNLGQPTGVGTTKRLYFIDWPILDRHRDTVAHAVDRWVDTQDVDAPCSIDGQTLRRTAATLATRPFRTRPTFNTTPWGGHWGQQRLGVNTEARNTALGYELIAPESGVLIGHGPRHQVEVPFQLIVSQYPTEVLGERVHAEYGTSFPIRFDYLDTVGGGNLSVHCHPQAEYMRHVFGWPYTQHETYYLLVAGDGAKVYLGLRGGVDVDEFHARARTADERGLPFDIEEYVQPVPAVAHQLLMIPAGTPHGSGEGNVVLEVSATPYLYSLRFYDWLRRDDGGQRPVHVQRAFANLDTRRQGSAVGRELVQPARILRAGKGWHEELLGSAPEMFFQVRRLVLPTGQRAHDNTDGRFHVLNVVEGSGVTVETESGYRHDLAYAETMVIPASVGAHTIHPVGEDRVRIVKSLVMSGPADRAVDTQSLPHPHATLQ